MLYFKRPEAFHARLNNVIDGLQSTDIGCRSGMDNIFSIIAREYPQLITSEHIDLLMTELNNRSGAVHHTYYFFEGLTSIANVQPRLFDRYQNVLVDFVRKYQNVSAAKCLQQYFVASTIARGPASAKEYLTILTDLLHNESKLTNEIRSQFFHTCQLIGIINKEALVEKREVFLKFNSETECRVLIDFIDGKKLSEESQTMINQTREEIIHVEKRVIRTEENIVNVDGVVKEQELKVNLVLFLFEC